MAELHTLVNFSALPENDFQSRGLPQHPPIQGENGAYYGHEWARWRYDTLDLRVDEILRAMPSGSRALDLGCATGSRAEAFARMGIDVTAVDILDRAASIAARAAAIGPDRLGHGTGTLFFLQADLRTWPAPGNERWPLIHARRVINFMTIDEAGHLFARLCPRVAEGGVLALSFVATGLAGAGQANASAHDRESVRFLPGFFGHDFDRVLSALKRAGFSVAEAFSDGLCDAACVATV